MSEPATSRIPIPRLDWDLPDTSFVEYPAVMILAHVLNGRGLAREKADDLTAAEKDYTKAIHLNPAYATAHNNRGTIRFLRQDYALALADYERAIAHDPAWSKPTSTRAGAPSHGSYGEAADDFDRVLRIDREYQDARICRGFALGKAEDLARLAPEHCRPLRPEHED